MRRSIVAVVVATGLTLSVLAAGSPQAAGSDPTGAVTDDQAQAALATARAVFADSPASARRTTSSRPDATLALRDLFAARDRLTGDDRDQADSILARPTDGASDRFGDGYTVPATKKCKNNFCIHWVTSTTDAPPSQAWVDSNLAYMNKVWRAEVRGLGFRKPIPDRRRGGGKNKFDVYLKDVGAKGLYGYCAPEYRTKKYKWLASGFCVLDNDFAEAQFGAPPGESFKVTAAHEFFHAVQFAYDYGEDGWLLEATATWMEERVADGVNDNRQYLPSGQIGDPGKSLDVYDRGGFNQYGNWTFFEYLSTKFGKGVVKAIWKQAGESRGDGHQYSTTAVKRVLKRHGGFLSVYRNYAGANTVPGRVYPEGQHWPTAAPAANKKLSHDNPRATQRLKVNHMAARVIKVRPGSSLGSKRWKLRVVIDGPSGKTSPAAYLVVKRKNGVSMKPIRLNGKGKGSASAGFSVKKALWARVVVVNASTRFNCWKRTSYSCQGKARDNNMPFTVRTSALLPKKRHG